MKKEILFTLAFILIFSSSMSFVSADPIDELVGGVSILIDTAYEIFKPVLELILNESSGSDEFFGKILFLIIIFIVVWIALGNFPLFKDKSELTWAKVLLAITVSILSIRWFGGSEVFQAAILPYTTFGIVVTAGLPFVLYFFIVKDFTLPISRKVAWAIFGAVFIGLYFSRWEQIGSAAWAYLYAAVASLIMILMDGTFKKWMNNQRRGRTKAKLEERELIRLNRELNQLYKDREEGVYDYMPNGEELFKKRRKAIEKRLKELEN